MSVRDVFWKSDMFVAHCQGWLQSTDFGFEGLDCVATSVNWDDTYVSNMRYEQGLAQLKYAWRVGGFFTYVFREADVPPLPFSRCLSYSLSLQMTVVFSVVCASSAVEPFKPLPVEHSESTAALKRSSSRPLYDLCNSAETSWDFSKTNSELWKCIRFSLFRMKSSFNHARERPQKKDRFAIVCYLFLFAFTIRPLQLAYLFVCLFTQLSLAQHVYLNWALFPPRYI